MDVGIQWRADGVARDFESVISAHADAWRKSGHRGQFLLVLVMRTGHEISTETKLWATSHHCKLCHIHSLDRRRPVTSGLGDASASSSATTPRGRRPTRRQQSILGARRTVGIGRRASRVRWPDG